MKNPAILIQAFIKVDTLKSLCESLLKCEKRQEFDLIFWTDSITGSARAKEYAPKQKKVLRYIKSYSDKNRKQFRSISILGNSENHGTCKTCQLAIDCAFTNHDFVIFTEDDTIFSSDALIWFKEIAATSDFQRQDVWAIAGESVLFDARREAISLDFIEQARKYANDKKLWNYYFLEKFIPSTCFATNHSKWVEFSFTRGQKLGDEDVCKRCEQEQKRCLFPVIPRVKDIGMLHPDGYSIAHHSPETVRGVKNSYLMSSDLDGRSKSGIRPKLYDANINELYWRSTDLKGFAHTNSPSDSKDHGVSRDVHTKLLDKARKSSAKSNWELALKFWSELENSGLSTAEVVTNAALCLLKLGRVEASKTKLEPILESTPDAGYPQSILAYILEAQGDISAARNVWCKLAERSDLPDWLVKNAENGKVRCTVV